MDLKPKKNLFFAHLAHRSYHCEFCFQAKLLLQKFLPFDLIIVCSEIRYIYYVAFLDTF